MLYFSLTPVQLELQKKVREFAIKEVFPASWHYDEKDEIPIFVLKKAFNAGIMSSDIPARYEGMACGVNTINQA